jgi:hypothetical protein
MKMPCLLYVGEIDEVYPMTKECAKKIANVTLVVLSGLDHGEAIRRSDGVLPHFKRFLANVTPSIKQLHHEI